MEIYLRHFDAIQGSSSPLFNSKIYQNKSIGNLINYSHKCCMLSLYSCQYRCSNRMCVLFLLGFVWCTEIHAIIRVHGGTVKQQTSTVWRQLKLKYGCSLRGGGGTNVFKIVQRHTEVVFCLVRSLLHVQK